MKILLIQARLAGDPMARHEIDSFSDACGLPAEHFEIFNMVTHRMGDFRIEGVDAVMIGGSGEFSLAQGGFVWHDDFLDIIRRIVEVGIPTFGSCFGFQGIVQALGGRLEADEDRSEVGTFSISLTEDVGEEDPIFGHLPPAFDAQLGHNDSVIELPDGLTHLASSERCHYQAIRVGDGPIVASQFHPELTREGSLARFRNYLEGYKRADQNMEEAMAYAEAMHRPSSEASSLLRAFVDDVRRRQNRYGAGHKRRPVASSRGE